MKPIGPIRVWTKAHSCANQSLTCRWSPRKSDMKTTLIKRKKRVFIKYRR